MVGMSSAAAVPTEFLEYATLSLVIAISVVFLCYHLFISFEFGAKLPKLAPEAMHVFMGYTAEDLLLSLYSKNKRGPNANWVFHFLQSRSPLGSLTQRNKQLEKKKSILKEKGGSITQKEYLKAYYHVVGREQFMKQVFESLKMQQEKDFPAIQEKVSCIIMAIAEAVSVAWSFPVSTSAVVALIGDAWFHRLTANSDPTIRCLAKKYGFSPQQFIYNRISDLHQLKFLNQEHL